MTKETLFISPAEFDLEDTLALQAAVDRAEQTDVRVVSVRAKKDGSPWHLSAPVLLPSFVTVIVDGAVVEAEGVAFINRNARDPEKQNLGGEQHKIFILGMRGGSLRALGEEPLIALHNCRDCRIADLYLEGGIDLSYFRYSKIQKLKITHSKNGITFREGCNNIILESLHAETEGPALSTSGVTAKVMGRDCGIYNSIFCRIFSKTSGAPAILLEAGEVPLYNLVLRDVSDGTKGDGSSIVIGKASDKGEIRDLTVRGVKSLRNGIHTRALCDGMFFGGIECEGEILIAEEENTRQCIDDESIGLVLPEAPENKGLRPFITPNEEGIMGDTDSESIQNAVNAAAKRGVGLVVIPRINLRRGKALWELEKAVKVPSDTTIVFLHAYLRQEDFCYENMFTNTRAYEHEGRCIAHEEHDLVFSGIGDVVLDGGKPNGLLEKTCNLYGLPDKRYNATVLFNNVRNLVLENMQFRQSRWYATYFIHCDTCRISGLDFDEWEDCCNRDGVDIRSGCHNFLVENITGTTGDDTVALNNLGNDGNDGRAVAGKDPDTLNMVIRNVKSDAGRWFTVRLLCQDRHLEQNFLLDTIMDVSSHENKKNVDATVMIGSHEYHYKIPAELGDLAHLTIRDVYSSSRQGVAFGGCSDDVSVSNVHGYGDNFSAISVRKEAKVRNVRIRGVFFKREHHRLKENTLARAYEGVAIHLPKLSTDSMRIENVYADSARIGVFICGNAKVTVENFHLRDGKQKAVCGGGCTLELNGEAIPTTEQIPL